MTIAVLYIATVFLMLVNVDAKFDEEDSDVQVACRIIFIFWAVVGMILGMMAMSSNPDFTQSGAIVFVVTTIMMELYWRLLSRNNTYGPSKMKNEEPEMTSVGSIVLNWLKEN